jgi:8-oxo-dGTP pyrophosphatase MutT (NUDIX family)
VSDANFDQAGRPEWVPRLIEALDHPHREQWIDPLRPAIGARPAAVLILIGTGDDGPEILFVERASTLRTHAGQIALPGGAQDAADADLADTALREAYEETGVDPTGIQVLGALPPAHVSVSGFDVTAVVGWWRTRSPVGAADPREVASTLMVSVAELTHPDHRARVRHPSGYIGPAFEVAGHLIWGLTAHLVDGLLSLAGWQRSWNRNRVLPIPSRYLTDRSSTGGHDAH